MRASVWPCLLVLLGPACGGGDDTPPRDGAVTLDAAVDAPVDAPASRTCGGLGGGSCRADEYCDYTFNTCGATDETGVCQPRPTSCPDLLVAIPTCACDNQVYSSPCDAYAAGADLNALGGCPVPGGSFACGYTQCNLRTQYCERQVSDVANEPDTWTCRALPACPSELPTCTCLAGETCGHQCSGQGATGLTLTCPGG